MLAPLVPFSLRGVIWYQGENNSEDRLYLEKMTALISEWRDAFRNPNLPFYFVQLAAWEKSNLNPAGGGWGMIRDLQRQCLAISHTGMAVTIDIGDANDIHPKNKKDVGERLALWALQSEYGLEKLEVSGPLFQETSIEDGKIRVHFTHANGGLITGKKQGTQPVSRTPENNPKGFAIAGDDRKWCWADAVIDGETVLLSSAQVPHPKAVRYAYASNPEDANLYNKAGLPASPFRTDDW